MNEKNKVYWVVFAFIFTFLLGVFIGCNRGDKPDPEINRLKQQLEQQAAEFNRDLSEARNAEREATESLNRFQEQYSGIENLNRILRKRNKDLERIVKSIESGLGVASEAVTNIERGITDSQGIAAESGKLIAELRKQLQ
jgi:chromosome segregation ATPase